MGIYLIFQILIALFSFSLLAREDLKGIRSGDGLSVFLEWSEKVDLDLFVTGPDGVTIYFANERGTKDGKLKEDVRCSTFKEPASVPPFREEVNFFATKKGKYRIGVDFIKDCGSNIKQEEFEIRLVRSKKSQVLGNKRQVAKKGEFRLIVWEFEIQ